MKKKMLMLLLNYNPLWLRIGLETIFGQIIPMEGATDALILSQFILTRLLSNPDILAMFAHPTVPHHYRDGHEQALKKFTLKKILNLIYFLDQVISIISGFSLEYSGLDFSNDSKFCTEKPFS